MIEPTIKIGFIIFNEEWKTEIEWNNGHAKTAREWIIKNNLKPFYEQVKVKNNLYDEEDFIINYIGAIKLYASSGNFYCYAPRIVSLLKNHLCKYYQSKGYKIIGDTKYDNEEKIKVKKFACPYNRTVIKSNNKLVYNPYREGD